MWNEQRINAVASDRKMRDRKMKRMNMDQPNRPSFPIFLSLIFLSLCIFSVPCPAEEPRPADALRDAYREDAEKSVFTRADGQPLKLVADPIMRWANDDDWSGDVFAWTYEGRPEVIGCMLSGPGANKLRYVYHEYHLLADQPIAAANVQDGRRWQPAEGLKRQRLPDAPKPAESPSARLAQMRKIARSFTAHMEADGRWELRLLPQPLMRYGDGDGEAIGGALFCYVWTKGTDPEIILLVEGRRDGDESAWYYAPVLFTNREVWLKHGDREVWHVQPHREPAGKSTTQIYTTGFARSMSDKKAETKSQKSK
jgi:hypothetical protein